MSVAAFEEVMQRIAAADVRPLDVSEMEKLLPLLMSFSLSIERAKTSIAKEAMREAVRALGGASNLAREIGASRQSVTNWCARGAPVDRGSEIALATGVSRNLLLPLNKGRAKAAPKTLKPISEGRL